VRITLSLHSVYPSGNDGSLLTVSICSLYSTNVTSAINVGICAKPHWELVGMHVEYLFSS